MNYYWLVTRMSGKMVIEGPYNTPDQTEITTKYKFPNNFVIIPMPTRKIDVTIALIKTAISPTDSEQSLKLRRIYSEQLFIDIKKQMDTLDAGEQPK